MGSRSGLSKLLRYPRIDWSGQSQASQLPIESVWCFMTFYCQLIWLLSTLVVPLPATMALPAAVRLLPVMFLFPSTLCPLLSVVPLPVAVWPPWVSEVKQMNRPSICIYRISLCNVRSHISCYTHDNTSGWDNNRIFETPNLNHLVYCSLLPVLDPALISPRSVYTRRVDSRYIRLVTVSQQTKSTQWGCSKSPHSPSKQLDGKALREWTHCQWPCVSWMEPPSKAPGDTLPIC